MIEYGIDREEAAALAIALELRDSIGEGGGAVILTSDGDARKVAQILNIKVHGDLYVVELAKLFGYCSSQKQLT